MNADLNANAQASLYEETMPVNRDSPIPLHHQVRSYLLGCIERGELLPGQILKRIAWFVLDGTPKAYHRRGCVAKTL